MSVIGRLGKDRSMTPMRELRGDPITDVIIFRPSSVRIKRDGNGWTVVAYPSANSIDRLVLALDDVATVIEDDYEIKP